MASSLVLAIETSCDETAVAIANSDGDIIASVVASQIALHAPYGGVVPELASRNHSLDLRPVISETLASASIDWDEIGAVAATSGPGLSSSLLVGDTTGKAIAAGLGVPFFSINHMEGHLLSPFIGKSHSEIPPHVALIVSGGHTLLAEVSSVSHYKILGTTDDDAAGEAFDKVGKMLGLPYPGGPEIASRAERGSNSAFQFPRSLIDSGDHRFSFSGLKTAALYTLQKLSTPLEDCMLDDFCASFEEAIIDVLQSKLFAALDQTGVRIASVSGGVSCNRALRERLSAESAARGVELYLSEPQFSTDNAAMIAFAAAKRQQYGLEPSQLDTDINPNLALA